MGRAYLRLKTAVAAGTKIIALHFTTATNFSYSLLQRSIVTVSGASPHRYVRQPTLAFLSPQCYESAEAITEPSMPVCFTPFSISRSAFSATLGIVKRACLCSRLHENSHGLHTQATLLFLRKLRKRQADYPPIEVAADFIPSPRH